MVLSEQERVKAVRRHRQCPTVTGRKPTERALVRTTDAARKRAMKSSLRGLIELLERGGRTPRIDTLIKLAASLSVTTEQLLAGITWAASQHHRWRVHGATG